MYLTKTRLASWVLTAIKALKLTMKEQHQNSVTTFAKVRFSKPFFCFLFPFGRAYNRLCIWLKCANHHEFLQQSKLKNYRWKNNIRTLSTTFAKVRFSLPLLSFILLLLQESISKPSRNNHEIEESILGFWDDSMRWWNIII